MRTIARRGRAMIMSASEMLDRARPFASALVEHQERSTGSRMAAYEGVASWVGVSSSWLRKLIGRQPVVMEAHEFHNIADVYRSLCERIEAARDREINKTLALREQADAALQGALGMVASAAGSEASGARAVSDATDGEVKP